MLMQFLRDRRGNVAPMLALSALPLMTAAGMAVDYTRANSAKTAFQSALDSAALALAKQGASNLSAAALQTQASNYVNALFSFTGAKNITVTAAAMTSGGSQVTVSGTATIPTDFMGIIGYNSLSIGGTATATWGNNRLRVALVLDNTGSMADSGKITALKTAAHNLLTQLKQAANTADDVYVSVIPFSKDVNFGSSNYNASWLRWDLWDAANGSCSKSKYSSSESTCTSHSGTWNVDHTTWNGCVTDRDQNYDTTNDAPIAGATLYPAEQYSYCPTSLMGLSNDWTALSNKIDAMQPNGNTNQAIGLQVGWQSLTASPFTVPTKDPNYKYSDIIILLTDGLNTQDRWYTSQSSIDTRQQKTCDNIKAAGITLYTVQVNTGGDPTSTLLQNCASDSSKFFLLTSSNQIITTFNQIGTALTQLRLAN
jgi:Flp pilus assembly protein TadG